MSSVRNLPNRQARLQEAAPAYETPPPFRGLFTAHPAGGLKNPDHAEGRRKLREAQDLDGPGDHVLLHSKECTFEHPAGLDPCPTGPRTDVPTLERARPVPKVGPVAREFQAGRFYKRSGTWGGWCDYLPVCLGVTQKVEETLIRIR